MYSVVGIGIGIGLIALGILATLVAGVRSVMNGKQDFKKIITFLVPFAVFGIAYGVTSDFGDAGIATMIFMMGAMVLTITLSGLRSSFNL